MPPRLVMVKQPPCISSSVSLPARAFSASWPSSAASSSTPFLSTSRMTGTSRPRSVSTATPMWTYCLRITASPAMSIDALTCGNALSAAAATFERHRRHRQLALRLRLEALAELLAQRLEIGDVGLLVLRDVRHAGPRVDHVLAPSCGGWRASAGDRSGPTSRSRAATDRRQRAAAARLRGDDLLAVGEDVVGRDPAAGAGAAHGVDVEPELPREAADRRRRGRDGTRVGGRRGGCRRGGGAAASRARSRRAHPVRCPSAWRRRSCRRSSGADAAGARGLAFAGAGAGAAAPPPSSDDHALTDRDLVAGLDLDLGDGARHRRRHFDCRLVGLELEDALVLGDRVADLDEDVQDVAALDAVAEVREC